MTEEDDKKGSVLIVDDIKKNIQILAEILNSHNYEIITASNGFEALKILERSKPDLILLDIMMPKMDGYETCVKIKENKEMKDVPVIFLTAINETKNLLKGFELGAVDYITKPFKVPELLARVSTHIELKKNRDKVAKLSRERKELIHVLCHDLINPICSVSTILQIEKESPNIFNELKDQIEISMNNSLEMLKLVRMIMALEDGKTKLHLSSYNLKNLIVESYNMLRNRFQEKKIFLEISIDDNIDVVVEKTSFINSVLNNLLTNAIKFSSNGSTIELKSFLEENTVSFAIIDHGIGMPLNLLENLFNVEKVTSRAGTNGEPGTGYGMPLVKKFVEAYGGSIKVNSREQKSLSDNHGTEIILNLPLKQVEMQTEGIKT
ncbi:MAG: hybrid sensor histidine kinase/response regulator [Spirochaetia bacterium]|nr:hybrid sensor histidine kinase/response regulator [Spirochaetia bacterium]